jgi:PEGA domain
LLSAEETVAYIDYRLKQAGYNGDPLFTEDALKLISETSLGTPRTINNLCFNALSLCSAMNSKQVDDGMVAKVVANLQLVPQSSEAIAIASNVESEQPSVLEPWKQAQRMLTLWGLAAADHVKLWVPAVAVLLIMCVLGVIRLTEVGASPSGRTGDDRSLNSKVAAGFVPNSAAPKIRKAIVTKPAPNKKPFEMGYTVGHHDSAPSLVAAQAAATTPASAVAGAPTPAQASLNIDSIPSGADIEIDGAFVGSTPSTVSIAPGSYQIAVKKNGFTDWSKTLSVTGGAIHLNAELGLEAPKQ